MTDYVLGGDRQPSGLVRLAQSIERASLGDLHFFSRAPLSPPTARPNLVSTSLFKFSGAYRELSKYARGLTLLAAAVRALLPTFSLRVYCDASVDPRTLRAAGARADADAMESALSAVAAGGGSVVWFRCDAAADGTGGHRDLFGTLTRFVPLFVRGGALPTWCGGPPDGAVVFCTDADFADFAVERAMVALAAWAAERSGGGSGGGGDGGGGGGCGGAPELAALTTGASAAPRHAPAAGMPPFIANCVVTTRRFPLAWFADFLRDAQSPGAGSLTARHAADVHDARSRNFTFEKRNIAVQTSRWPFGVDEFFLSVLKARAVARTAGDAAAWLFIVVPNLDIVVRKALGALTAGAARAGEGVGAGGDAERERLCRAAAAVAGAPSPGDASRAALVRGSAAWTRDWPAAASARTGNWERVRAGAATPLRFADGAAMRSVAADTRELWLALVDALAAGAVPSTTAEELDYALQGAATAAAIAPNFAGALAYTVVGGAAALLGSSSAAASAAGTSHVMDALYRLRNEPLPGGGSGGESGGAAEVVLDDAQFAVLRGGGEGVTGADNDAAAEPGKKRARTLPAGWVARESKSTGRAYYYHAESNTSAWECPE